MWGSHRKLCPIIRGSRMKMDWLWLCLSRKSAAPFSGLIPQIKTNQENIKFSDLHWLSAQRHRHRPQEKRPAAVNESCRHHGLITKYEELTFTVKVSLWLNFFLDVFVTEQSLRSQSYCGLTEVRLHYHQQHAGEWVTPVFECNFRLPLLHQGDWDPRGPDFRKVLLLFQ